MQADTACNRPANNARRVEWPGPGPRAACQCKGVGPVRGLSSGGQGGQWTRTVGLRLGLGVTVQPETATQARTAALTIIDVANTNSSVKKN